MKSIFLTFSIFILTLNSCLSQEQVKENRVKKGSDIHDQYQYTEAQSIKYNKVERDILEESSESGTVIGYYYNGKLKKISAEVFGEMGKVKSNYYLNSEGSLFFVLNQTSTYDKPIYTEGSETKNVEEEEYYYDGNKLFKWVKSNIEQQMNTPEFKNEDKRFLDNFKHYKTIIENNSKTIQLNEVRKEISILSINKSKTTNENNEFRLSCEKWTLDKPAILHIASLAKPISTHDFMYLYNVLPCEVKGKILVGATEYDYVINAGSFMKLSQKDTTYYYDCSSKECQKYFLSKGGNPERDLGE